MAKLPARFTSALDRGTVFSHTEYNFDRLLEVCEKLARQAVVRCGGRIERTADEQEVFVIPVETPRAGRLETCWEPGPAAGSRFTAAETAKIQPPTSK